MVGYTPSTDFPTTAGALQTTKAAGFDGFIVKLDSLGSSLVFSTYFGGSGDDYLEAVAVANGAVYMSGYTRSTDYPVTASALQSSLAGTSGSIDATLTILRLDGTLQYSSYYGGGSGEQCLSQSIAVDSSANAYLLASTSSSDLPIVSAYDTTRGAQDCAIAKFAGVVPLFTFVPVTLPDWTAGFGLEVQLNSTGGYGAVTWAVTSGSFPSGMSLQSGGLLTGTPTSSGSYTATVAATDGLGQIVQRQLTWTINDAPAIDPIADATWTRSRPYTASLSSHGGTAPLTWLVATGVVPAGLTFDAAGKLRGTPISAGWFAFDAMVEDRVGAYAVRTVVIQIVEPPSIASKTLPDCTEHIPLYRKFTATGGTPPLVWSLVEGEPPFDEPIDAAAGTFDATTLDAGTYSFTLRVADATGATGDGDFAVTLNPFPVIDTVTLPIAAAGRPYVVTPQAHGGTPPVGWTFAEGQPAGLSLDSTSGRIAGTPVDAGVTSIHLSYYDVCGALVTATLPFTAAGAIDLTRKKASFKIAFDPAIRPGAAIYYVELVGGTTLGLSVLPSKKKSPAVTVDLLDGSGTPVDPGATLGGNSYRVKAFVVPATGRYFLRITPPPATTESVAVAMTVSAPSSFGQTIHLDATQAPTDLRITVIAGATVTVTVKPTAKSGKLLPKIVSFSQDGSDLVKPGEVKGSNPVTLKLKTPLAAGSAHLLLSAAPGTSGDAAVLIKVRQPRNYVFSLPDVASGE